MNKVSAVSAVSAESATWKKPARFDRNLVVIGAGSAGLVAAYVAASLKAKVTLVEKNRMGGDCRNTGCVPSKALIRSAKLLSHMARCNEFGIASARAEFVLAMKHGIGLSKLLWTIHIYPTFSEAGRYVASNWTTAHPSAKLLSLVERIHAWRRG